MRARMLTSLMVLLSVGVALLLGEAGVRLKDGIPLFSTDNFLSRALDKMRQPGLIVYDSRLGWVQAPNLRVRYDGNSSYTTGELGERMPDRTPRAPQQQVILAVGDSFTAGAEVSDSESWPAQLEAILGTPVINAGVLGHGVDQIVLRAEDLVPRLHPKVLLVGLLTQDSFRNHMSVYNGAPKPYFKIVNGDLALHNVPVPRLASTAHDIGRLRATLGRSYLFHFLMVRLNKLSWWEAGSLAYQEVSTKDEAMEISCLLMKRLAHLRDQYSVRVGIIVEYGGPECFAKDPPEYGPPLIACAQRAGLEATDDFQVLRSVLEKDGMDAFHRLWVLHDNDQSYGHMSAQGNRLVASRIATSFFGKSAGSNSQGAGHGSSPAP